MPATDCVPHTPNVGSSSYEELKAYYDDVLNKDKSLFKTSNDEPTPIACVEEMVATMSEDVFKDGSLRWLDPCCGNGNFFLVIFFKLLRYHSAHHILTNMLFFNDTNTDRLNVVQKVFCHGESQISLNTTSRDFLECGEHGGAWNSPDIIVANPPFAKILPNGKRASKNHNLIGPFLKRSFDILNNGGYLLFITPDNWMSFADRNTVIKTITSKQIVRLDIHTAKKHFKKVGSSFTWYLVKNSPGTEPFHVTGMWHKRKYESMLDSYERSFIPLYYTSEVDSIFRKTVQDPHLAKFAVETSSDLHRYTKRHLIVDEPDEEHPYTLIHTPSTMAYASRPHKYQDGFKVFISTTSYYSTFVANVGMTQSVAFVRCDSEEQANTYKQTLDHPLYRFLNNVCRWGNFNNVRILQQFPFCEGSDYDTVYRKFGITTEERTIIEQNS